MAAEAVVGTLGKALQDDKKTDEEVLQFKDFVWDQFLKYISSAILALTILNLSVEFLRGGGVLCFPPLVTKDVTDAEPDELDLAFSVRQSDFFNGYCSRSIPPTEFFPLYILVHGLLLIAPHYIWTAVFRGDFDSFFAVTRKLDRLRDRNTGEYDPTNFDRVEKLEIEFGGKRRKIFYFYIVKLLLQFCVCIGSYMFSAAFFINFASVFDCPRGFSESNIPEKWPLNATIPCVYTSLRILSLIRYADYILLALAMVLIVLGLVWCAIRHTKELGYRDIATFVFQSCLSTKTYVFPPFYKVQRRKDNSTDGSECWLCPKLSPIFRQGNKRCFLCTYDVKIFSPRIQNDLDFFEMYLFRADTSHGRVFKEIQIDKVLRKLHGEDHQLLHLFLDAQRDMKAQVRDKEIAAAKRQAERQRDNSEVGGSGAATEPTLESSVEHGPSSSVEEGVNSEGESPISPDLSRVEDLASFFKMGPGGFARNPETFAFIQLKEYLSNIEWKPVEGIRDRLYGFVLYSPKHTEAALVGQPKTNMAVDISFGSSGYALVLARAFKKVVSVNFHPFFRNEKDPVKKRAFYTNYIDVNLPVDIFTQVNTNITKATEKIFEHMRKPRKNPADFIVVGPLTEESQRVTVTLTIETMHTVALIEESAVLLAVRPLVIGHRNTTKQFWKYEPSKALFDDNFHTDRVAKDLSEQLGDEANVMIDGFSGIRVNCGDTECVFEFVAYKYKGTSRDDDDNDESSNGDPIPPPPHGNLTRSQSMPPLANIAELLGQHMLNSLMTNPMSPPLQPQLIRSNTTDGSFPGRSGSIPFSPPGSDVFPNNDVQLLLQQKGIRRASGDGVAGVGRGRGRAISREAMLHHSCVTQRGRSVGGLGERWGHRQHSSSSGFVSPPSTHFESVSEEEDSYH